MLKLCYVCVRWGRNHEANFHKNEVFGRFAVANQNFIQLKNAEFWMDTTNFDFIK